MAQKLVNKQFNSPIGLYSDANIRDIMDRDAEMLSNGTMGINFHNPMHSKPANLHNSAVLRMLEEEEKGIARNGHATGVKRVAWPPPKDEEFIAHEPIEAQGGANYSTPSTTYPPSRTTVVPVQQSPPVSSNRWTPVQPPHSPQPQQPQQQQQQQYSIASAPVYTQAQQPPVESSPLQCTQPVQQVLLQSPPVRNVEPPPSVITLRPHVPITQAPAPVFTSQPATATYKGGKNLRGDMKWPPEDVKDRMAEENRQRVELAKGPTFRPRRVKKDYSAFFAQHALNSAYPGYKIPPGTQYYDHHPMM